MKTRRIIPKEVEDRLIEKIIEYAKEYQLTAGNIEEAVVKALEDMKYNALLEKEPYAFHTAQKD